MDNTPKGKGHKFKIILLIVLPLAAAATLIYILNKPKKKLPNQKEEDSQPNTQASRPKTASSPSVFPLRNGSPKNDLVKQLQTLLGVGADGLFGPKTLAALVAQTGKTQIASQSEFDTIINNLQSKPVIAAGKARADQLTSQWNASSETKLMALSTVTCTGVTQDVSGALQPNGKGLQLKGSQPLSHADYQPMSGTTAGYLLFQVLNGSLIGMYKVDANQMTVVK